MLLDWNISISPNQWRAILSLQTSRKRLLIKQKATPLGVEAQNKAPQSLDKWEAEVDPSHLEKYPNLAYCAVAIQFSITNQIPIDSSSDWEDLKTYFSVTAALLERSNDLEARESIRSLFIAACFSRRQAIRPEPELSPDQLLGSPIRQSGVQYDH